MREVLRLSRRELETMDESRAIRGLFSQHRQEIRRRLRELGAVQYDIVLPETHIIPLLLQPTESIKGIVYGRYRQEASDTPIVGRGALIATDSRVLLVDRKPMFMKCNEIPYLVISGVAYTRVAFMGTVTLNTGLGNIYIRTFNHKCAQKFVDAIEQTIILAGGYGSKLKA